MCLAATLRRGGELPCNVLIHEWCDEEGSHSDLSLLLSPSCVALLSVLVRRDTCA